MFSHIQQGKIWKRFFYFLHLVIDTRRRRSKKSRQMNAETSRDRFMRLIPEGWRRFNETQVGEKLAQKDSFEVKLEFFLRSSSTVCFFFSLRSHSHTLELIFKLAWIVGMKAKTRFLRMSYRELKFLPSIDTNVEQIIVHFEAADTFRWKGPISGVSFTRLHLIYHIHLTDTWLLRK